YLIRNINESNNNIVYDLFYDIDLKELLNDKSVTETSNNTYYNKIKKLFKKNINIVDNKKNEKLRLHHINVEEQLQFTDFIKKCKSYTTKLSYVNTQYKTFEVYYSSEFLIEFKNHISEIGTY